MSAPRIRQLALIASGQYRYVILSGATTFSATASTSRRGSKAGRARREICTRKPRTISGAAHISCDFVVPAPQQFKNIAVARSGLLR